MNDETKSNRKRRESRFVVKPEEMKFLTLEEAQIVRQEKRAKRLAHREKMLREAAEAREQEKAPEDTENNKYD